MKKVLLVIIMGLTLTACCKSPVVYTPAPAPVQPDNDQQLTIVQFCPNKTVYPTTFSEVAFCIDGSLYGVYSANGGFETYLPPGNYHSNGINSTCNFVVKPNCVVEVL